MKPDEDLDQGVRLVMCRMPAEWACLPLFPARAPPPVTSTISVYGPGQRRTVRYLGYICPGAGAIVRPRDMLPAMGRSRGQPHSPAHRRRGPHSPANRRRAPHSPAHRRRGPHSPTHRRRGPHSPAHRRRGPHSPAHRRRGPQSPAHRRRGPWNSYENRCQRLQEQSRALDQEFNDVMRSLAQHRQTLLTLPPAEDATAATPPPATPRPPAPDPASLPSSPFIPSLPYLPPLSPLPPLPLPEEVLEREVSLLQSVYMNHDWDLDVFPRCPSP